MSPPKSGYGGITIPVDPVASDPTERLLLDAARALRDAEKRFDEVSQRQDQRIRSLETEVGVLRGELAGVNAKLAKQSEDIASILVVATAAKGAWNHLGKQIIAYGLVLFAGGWGVSKATEKPPAPTQIVQQKSAIADLLEQCRNLPDYPPNNLGVTPRMECLIRISREQFTPR